MADISIQVTSENWSSLGEEMTAVVKQTADFVLANASHVDGSTVESETELSILLTDDEAIQHLNKDYRGKDKPTNVLSFPSPSMPNQELPDLLGDVILAFETINQEALDQRKVLQQHVQHLIVHGVLHLLGYDHQTDQEAEQMEALEVSLLGDLGVANPYHVTPQAGVAHG